jgi:SHS2 domain-containing protein
MGYHEIEHSGDCGIRVWADDLAALFADAAQGLYSLCGTRLGVGHRIGRQLSLQADDIEGLLVAFLSELLYLQESERLAFQELDLEVQEHRLTGTMLGRAVISVGQPLKAVTFHGLRIQRSDSQYSCEVIFDA